MWSFSNINSFSEWTPIIMSVIAAIYLFMEAYYKSRSNIDYREYRIKNDILYGVGCLVFAAACIYFYGTGDVSASTALADIGSTLIVGLAIATFLIPLSKQ